MIAITSITNKLLLHERVNRILTSLLVEDKESMLLQQFGASIQPTINWAKNIFKQLPFKEDENKIALEKWLDWVVNIVRINEKNKEKNAKSEAIGYESNLPVVESLTDDVFATILTVAYWNAKKGEESRMGTTDINLKAAVKIDNLIAEYTQAKPHAREIRKIIELERKREEDKARAREFFKNETVVYNFKDGWKMVELDNKEKMEREARLMHHCIGGSHYVAQQQRGEKRYYSLRDPKNKPFVSIEIATGAAKPSQEYAAYNTRPAGEYTDRTAIWKRYYFGERIKGLLNTFKQNGFKTPLNQLQDLAGSPGTPAEVLRTLSADERLHGTLMNNTALPGDLAAKIIEKTNDINVKLTVLRASENRDLLMRLSADPNIEVRKVIAGNRNTPNDILAKYAEEEDEDVAYILSQNDKTPRRGVATILNRFFHVTHMMQQLVKHRNNTKETIEKLSTIKNYDIDMSIADNTKVTPPHVLATISERTYDEKEDRLKLAVLKEKIAANHRTPFVILDKALIATFTDNTLFNLQQILLKNKKIVGDYRYINDVIADLPEEQTDFIKSILALEENTHEDIIMALSHDKSVSVRSFVLNRLPTERLKEMLSDSDKGVRVYAAEVLKEREK